MKRTTDYFQIIRDECLRRRIVGLPHTDWTLKLDQNEWESFVDFIRRILYSGVSSNSHIRFMGIDVKRDRRVKGYKIV